MGRPVQADGRQTRQAILDAALDLFAQNGYFGTSLRDIATRVGVRESALYNYFPSKDALFLDLLAGSRESSTERLAAFLAGPIIDPRDFLERLTNTILDFFSDPRQQRLFLMFSSDGMRLAREGRINMLERLTSSAAPFLELMRRLVIEGGLAPRDPQLLAMDFMGPLLLWRQYQAIEPQHPVVVNRAVFVRDHVDHFLRGAEPAGAATPHAVVATRGRSRTRRRRMGL